MVGEIFKIHFFEMAKNALESSTMVGENFESHFFEIAKNKSINASRSVLDLEIVIFLYI